MKLFSRAFWEFALERAVKTAAQSAVSLLTVDYTGLLNVDGKAVFSAVALAALVSVLTSLTTFSESAPDAGPDPLPNPEWAEQPADEPVDEPSPNDAATQVIPTVQ